jgi:hypothetical protein
MKSKRRMKVTYLDDDWPADQMSMDESMFARYAEQLEREDWEDDILCLSSSVRQLVHARMDTIAKLRASAEYLDSIWLKCRMSRTMGTSASVVGGGLTIAGGILTTLTAGAAAPVLIAGIATSSVGAATNIGTSLCEKALNSRQIKDMNSAFERDKDITLKLEEKIEDIKHYKDSAHLNMLLVLVQQLLGPDHILLTILKGILVCELSGSPGLGEFETKQIFPCDSSASLVSMAATAGVASTAMIAANAASSSSTSSTLTLLKASKDAVKFNQLDAGVLVEGGKVIGQNSFNVAGQVIIGISAAFMVWDAIDLGFTISDLVRKQGSRAGRVLREKADLLEGALRETVGMYSIEMPK